MFIQELAEPQLLVIYPGRFQPFHKGHHAVYQWLTGKFGRNNVWIATSNKVEPPKSPFNFAEKSYFMQLTGVPADRVIEATQPYNIENILQDKRITVANPDNTVVIFAVSEKDMAEDPRFKFTPRADGTDSYFQPLKNIKDTVSMKQHGYIMTVPTFPFAVLGKNMQSASEIRNDYAVLAQAANSDQLSLFVKDLFGRYTADAEQLMTAKLLPAEPAPAVKLGRQTKLQKVPRVKSVAEGYMSSFMTAEPRPMTAKEQWKKQIRDLIVQYHTNLPRLADLAREKGPSSAEAYAYKYILNPTARIPLPPGVTEEAAGVGVIASGRQARDPRYSTSLTRDVRPGQVGKNLRAFKLAESNIDRLADQLITHINQDIDAIKQRFATEKLPAEYRERLKQKIEQLKARRQDIIMGR